MQIGMKKAFAEIFNLNGKRKRKSNDQNKYQTKFLMSSLRTNDQKRTEKSTKIHKNKQGNGKNRRGFFL